MSLAPASSRGAFLKARLAVNGIQCAAKSLGTLTVGADGLLSSMAASSNVVGDRLWCKLSASRASGNFNNLRCFSRFERIVASAAQFRDASVGIERSASASQARLALTQGRGIDPEHFRVRLLGIEPEKVGLGIGSLERGPASADFAQ